MIYPHVELLQEFYLHHKHQTDGFLENAEHTRLSELLQEFCRSNGTPDLGITFDMIETLRAFRDGLGVDDLLDHNRKQLADSEPFETTTIYTEGIALMIEKIFGRGTINTVKKTLGELAEDPDQIPELANWVVTSWPSWKEKLLKYSKQYGPTVADIVKTAGEVLEPITDAPFKFLLGIGLREEVAEQRAFREKIGDMADAIAKEFDMKNHPELKID